MYGGRRRDGLDVYQRLLLVKFEMLDWAGGPRLVPLRKQHRVHQVRIPEGAL